MATPRWRSAAAGARPSRPISPPSSPLRPASSWRRRAPTANPISSIAAARPVSCTCSTTRPSLSPIFPAIANTSATGNLADNPKAHLFLIDYANRQRIKIWGEARIVEDDAALMQQLMPEGYKARPEQVVLFTVIGLGFQLPAAHPAALRGGRRRGGARAARQAHRRAGGRDRAAEGCGSAAVGLTRSHSSSAPDLATVLGRSPTSFSTSSPARRACVERRVST